MNISGELNYIKNYLDNKYEFRYNEISALTEFRDKGKNQNFRRLNEYECNSILIGLQQENCFYSSDKLNTLLKSNYVVSYNPFKTYFNNLELDDTVDYIKLLAETVSTTDDEFFYVALKKWLVAMVASSIEEKTINHTILVFSGNQGIGKTTWFKRLVPKELQEYYYEGNINMSNKDDKIQLAENILINIDELQSLTAKKLEALKATITSTEEKLRRVYARNHDLLPRRASFAGSVNQREFLSDTTGNRRFLCFEVKSINYNHDVPIDKVMAQAFHLFKSGFQHWFDSNEILLLNQKNEYFYESSLEEELVTSYLIPCSKDDEEARYGTTTDIMLVLEKMLKLKKISVSPLGKALTKRGFEFTKSHGIKKYAYKFKLAT